MKTELKSLLIIGNGFDLKCKLESKFSHFYNHRVKSCEAFKQLDGIFNTTFSTRDLVMSYITFFKNPGNVNFFDLYFIIIKSLYTTDQSWEMIEKIIQDLVIHKNKGLTKNKSLFDLIVDAYNTKIFHNKPIPKLNKDKIVFYMSLYLFELNKKNKDEMLNFDYTYLLAELNKFELNFKNYIYDEMFKEVTNYRKKSQELFDKIVPKNLQLKCSLLNFNYTNAIDIPFDFKDNVHGDCYDGSIIFGIDSGTISTNDPEYIFTKTYRKIANEVLKGNSKPINFLDTSIREIYFYGHSLNEQDYSYFQSIFDYFDLYNNFKVSLIFCYSIYDQKKKSEILLDQTKKVSALLERYGKTFDNLNKGKNLTHRLLNEKRIKFKLID